MASLGRCCRSILVTDMFTVEIAAHLPGFNVSERLKSRYDCRDCAFEDNLTNGKAISGPMLADDTPSAWKGKLSNPDTLSNPIPIMEHVSLMKKASSPSSTGIPCISPIEGCQHVMTVEIITPISIDISFYGLSGMLDDRLRRELRRPLDTRSATKSRVKRYTFCVERQVIKPGHLIESNTDNGTCLVDEKGVITIIYWNPVYIADRRVSTCHDSGEDRTSVRRCSRSRYALSTCRLVKLTGEVD
nr:hypothetical protein CFP56_09438 [Quercus suber]